MKDQKSTSQKEVIESKRNIAIILVLFGLFVTAGSLSVILNPESCNEPFRSFKLATYMTPICGTFGIIVLYPFAAVGMISVAIGIMFFRDWLQPSRR